MFEARSSGELSRASKPVFSFIVDSRGSKHKPVTNLGMPDSDKVSLTIVLASEKGESKTSPLRTWLECLAVKWIAVAAPIDLPQRKKFLNLYLEVKYSSTALVSCDSLSPKVENSP